MNNVRMKLAEIEATIERENSQGKLNRMPARYFMVFLLLGGDAEVRSSLERKVKELLRNPEACEILQITEPGKTVDVDQIGKALQRAAVEHVHVENLNSVYLCPILLSDSGLGSDVDRILTEIDIYMKQCGHEPIWQPAIIANKEITEYENIYTSVTEMARFVSDTPGRVNRCCWMSTRDENGFVVPMENLMQTVAMVVVLQNVIMGTEESGAKMLRERTSKGQSDNHLFFTARNAAVTNPRRSLILQRMAVAVDYFAGENEDADTLTKINYSFISEIMKPYLSRLPRRGGNVTLLPLFGVMGGNGLQERLVNTIKERYGVPLGAGVQVPEVEQRFLEAYFAANGSLGELKRLVGQKTLEKSIEGREPDCYLNVNFDMPTIDGKKLAPFNRGEYRSAVEECARQIKTYGWRLMGAAAKNLSQPQMLDSIERVQNELEGIRQCIDIRMHQLADMETIFVLDRTELANTFNEIQASWLAKAAELDHVAFERQNQRFDRKIYELLCMEDADCSDLLDICYEAVQNTAPTNVDYLKRVSDECIKNKTRAQEFKEAVERNGRYTLRFLKRVEAENTIYVVGDGNNQFCKQLAEDYNSSLFAFDGFDRIDILRISMAFSPEDVREWEQIEDKGKEAAEA